MSEKLIFMLSAFFFIIIIAQAKGILSMHHKVHKRHTTDGYGKMLSILINDNEAIIRTRNQLTSDERKELFEKLRNFINKLNDDNEELNVANASNALHESNTNSNYELITSLTNAADKNENNYTNLINEIVELRKNTESFRTYLNGDKLRKANKNDAFESCEAALSVESNHDGVYKIHLPKSGLDPFKVYCMHDDGVIEDNPRNGSAWTIILRRQDGSIDFFRDWFAYKHGFGNLSGEYFIGLQRLHALTQRAPQELYIKLMDFEDNTRYATYDNFRIGAATEKYSLNNLGTYSGNAGDALGDYVGMKFSTRDSDNDESFGHCAETLRGANWYKRCHLSHLFGPYKHEDEKNLRYADRDEGVTWDPWLGNRYSLKYAHMALRSVDIFN